MQKAKQACVLALPSKGRLKDQSLAFLSSCGFDVRSVGNGREYVAKFAGIDNIEVLYFRPDEIPSRVEHGDAHAGITGEDLYREFGDGTPASYLLMPRLGFGAARLVVAVPQSWVDVATMADLGDAAMIFRQRQGRSLRAATKFSRLSRAFFSDHGIVEYSLVDSLGATEGTPAAGVADFIVDLTSTGATLSENHLKEIAGGTVLHTQACLVASLQAPVWNEGSLAACEHLVEQIEAKIRASSTLVLRFSIPSEGAKRVLNRLSRQFAISSWPAAISRAAMATHESEDRLFLVALCERTKIYAAAKLAKELGASDVIVDRSEFIFEGVSPSFGGFKRALVSATGIGSALALPDR
jgi:ATP phosphoribosyltransferase